MKGFLAFILVGLLFISSLGFVANRLQNPDFLVEQTKQANFYGRLTGQLTEVLPKDFVKGFPISNEEFAAITKEAVPENEFYSFLRVYAGAYLDYWTGKSPTIAVDYSLAKVKERAKVALTNKVVANYDKLPECTAEQARNWDISENFPTCRLAEGSLSRQSIDRQLSLLVSRAVDGLPANIKTSGVTEQQQANRNLFSTANKAIKIVWIATLLLVILMIVIWRQKSFIALAIALLFVGLVQIGFSLIAWDWIAQNVGDALAGSGKDNLAPIAADAVATALEVLKGTLDNLTIIILGTGGALLVLGIYAAIRGRKTLELPK
jgi:hypothetical protein